MKLVLIAEKTKTEKNYVDDIVSIVDDNVGVEGIGFKNFKILYVPGVLKADYINSLPEISPDTRLKSKYEYSAKTFTAKDMSDLASAGVSSVNKMTILDKTFLNTNGK